MQFDDKLEEELMIAAFQRKQNIEATKLFALITAIVKPEKAHEAYLSYLKVLMPEYEQIRSRMDDQMIKSLNADKDKIFRLSVTRSGWIAQEELMNSKG